MTGILSTRTICCKVALDNAADAALRETQQAFNCATTYCASVAWEQGVTNKNKLHQAGALHQEIAECLNITRATVSRYLKATGFPERAPYPRLESKLDPYHTYLSERWAAGEINGRQLWQELQEQGYTGSVMSVMR